MLHIILLILKIIGFLILGVLALVLLLTAVILLAPFVYRLEFSVDNSLESVKGRIRFHWLMHLISGDVCYEDGSFDWHIRAGWKKFGDGPDDHKVTGSPQIRGQNDHADNHTEDHIDDRAENHTDDHTENCTDDRTEDRIDDRIEGCINDHIEETVYETDEPMHKHESESHPKSGPDSDKHKKISGLYERFKKIPEKIKHTFRRICDKIKTLKKKKDRIAAFLRNSTHQNAFSRLLKELKRLLHFLKPSDASVDLEFGFSDPSYTGYTLAGISMIYPMIGEYTQIKPDFEHKVLKGNVFIKGRIRILYGLIFAWNMFRDKNVRVTYRHIRKFRL